MASTESEKQGENPIEEIANSVYPAFALLAGMKLDLFTALKDSPLKVEQIYEIYHNKQPSLWHGFFYTNYPGALSYGHCGQAT